MYGVMMVNSGFARRYTSNFGGFSYIRWQQGNSGKAMSDHLNEIGNEVTVYGC